MANGAGSESTLIAAIGAIIVYITTVIGVLWKAVSQGKNITDNKSKIEKIETQREERVRMNNAYFVNEGICEQRHNVFTEKLRSLSDRMELKFEGLEDMQGSIKQVQSEMNQNIKAILSKVNGGSF